MAKVTPAIRIRDTYTCAVDGDIRTLRAIARAESFCCSAAGVGVGIATVALALYISFALLVNPSAGRVVFPIGGPLFKAAGPAAT